MPYSQEEVKLRAAEATKRWRAKNKDRYNETHKNWRAKNPQAGREAALRWHHKNKDVANQKSKKYYLLSGEDKKLWAQRLVSRTKARCKKSGVSFSISYKDILAVLPEDMMCPILCVKMQLRGGRGNKYSASIDKVLPELGYVPGNIAIISSWANLIKRDCTDPAIFRRIADWLDTKNSACVSP